MDEDRKKEMMKEVDELNRDLGMTIPEPKSDPPETDEPKTDAPTTDEPRTDAPTTDEPKTTPPATEPPDERDLIIKDLRERMDKLEKPSPTKPPSTKPPLEEQDFIGDIDVSELTKEDLNKLLNKVYIQGVKTSEQSITGVLPKQVTNIIEVVERMKKTNEEFYGTNEDLKPFQKVVATVFDELATANPKKHLDEILKATGPEVRKRLNLPTPENKPKPKGNDKQTPPHLPSKKGKPGGHQSEPTPKGVAADIEAMNKLLGR